MSRSRARLEKTGEFVDGQALAPEGTWVRYDGEGRPPVTDGPFAETKDLIAGWMVIDVDSYERAVELAGELSAAPGAGGEADPRVARAAPVPGRAAHHHGVTRRVNEVLLRSLTPSVLGDPRPPRSRLRGGRGRRAGRAGRGGPRLAGRPAAGPQGLAGHRGLAPVPRRDPVRHRPAPARGPSSTRSRRPGPRPAVDDTLQLYFLCAHPSLTPSSAVALTLRAVGGLTTRQIAQAYLVPEATMAQRISRAKRTVSDVRFDQPGDVATVLRVLYLVFNEGYSGDVDLAAEAIRLTRQLAAAIDHPEVAGLLALMLLHHARRAARTTPDGSLVPLAEQDRSRWDTAAIAEGVDGPAGGPRPRPAGRVPGPGGDRGPARRRADAPRRPTGCRSSSGTTSSCA